MKVINKNNIIKSVKISSSNESWCACNSSKIRPPSISTKVNK